MTINEFGEHMLQADMSLAEASRLFRRALICAALRKNRGNQCNAAKALGVHRNTLSRILDELDINVREFRPRR